MEFSAHSDGISFRKAMRSDPTYCLGPFPKIGVNSAGYFPSE